MYQKNKIVERQEEVSILIPLNMKLRYSSLNSTVSDHLQRKYCTGRKLPLNIDKNNKYKLHCSLTSACGTFCKKDKFSAMLS